MNPDADSVDFKGVCMEVVFLDNKNIEFVCNMLIVAKFYQLKCRFVKVSPCFAAFKNAAILKTSRKKLSKLLAIYGLTPLP